MERNKYLEFHADIMDILLDADVPYEVRCKVSERIMKYKDHINKQALLALNEIQKML